MVRYVKMDPPELAPRDIVTRSMMTEIEEGRGFVGPWGPYLNVEVTHLNARIIEERLGGSRELAQSFAEIDPERKPIPVILAQHYSMGWISTGNEGETCVPGVFAAGESACVSIHVANRLGGNSILETLVFGRRVRINAERYGREAVTPVNDVLITREAADWEAFIEDMCSREGGKETCTLETELQKTME